MRGPLNFFLHLGLVDNLSKSRGLPVIRRADFGNHCSKEFNNSFFAITYLRAKKPKLKIEILVKGAVSLISSDPPRKDGTARFTRVPLMCAFLRFRKTFGS